MAVHWLTLYRALLLLGAALGLFLISRTLANRGKPGVRPLLVLLIGGLIYIGAKLTVSVVRGTPTAFLFTRLTPLGAGLAAVGFTLVAIEYTGIEQPVSRRTAGLLFLVPAVATGLGWLDLHALWIPIGTDQSTVSGYAWELTGIALANQLYMMLLVIGGIVLLLWFGSRAAAPYRRQTGMLVVAGVGAVGGNLVFQLDLVPFNLAPPMFVFAAGLIVWATLGERFLDLVPISRDVVIENVETGVLSVDDDHRLIDINDAGRQLFALDADAELVGRHVDDVFSDQPRLRELYWEATAVDSGETIELEYADRYLDIEITTLPGPGASVVGRSFLIRDITEQEERARALAKKNERLDEFASVVSHDLRNPLNVAIARLRLARTEQDSEHLEAVADSHDRMQALIEDVLALAREGAAVEESQPINLASISESCWGIVDSDAPTLQIETDRVIEGDRGRIRRLLENLFRNAVEHGGNEVTVTIGELSDGFYVEDDGPGIPAADRQDVFKTGYTTTRGGTGFGLSIVGEIVESHNWTIEATESQSGGARFEIREVSVVE